MFDWSVRNLSEAWDRVRANAGCAGVDGVTVEGFERQVASGLPELLLEAQNGRYCPLPLRTIIIEKSAGTGKTRTLLVPTVRDRVLQTAMARYISRSWEEEFVDASYGYRPRRGVDHAAARIIQLRNRGWTWVLDADISGYFDHVSHARLLRLLKDAQLDAPALAVLHQWIKADAWDGHALSAIRRGIPQGSPISPLLANYFLLPFDLEMEKSGDRLIRYADDFLVLCQSREAADAALRRVAGLLASAGLQLNDQKTRIVTFEEGFSFLGILFRGSEAMVPWKLERRTGRLVFIAPRMPLRLLKDYRARKSHRNVGNPHPQPSKPAGTGLPRAKESNQEVIGMACLYLTQQGAILRKSGDRFLVEQDQQILKDLPYHRLQQILVFGNVQVTTQAMAEALDKGIRISFFSRHGRYRGSLQSRNWTAMKALPRVPTSGVS